MKHGKTIQLVVQHRLRFQKELTTNNGILQHGGLELNLVQMLNKVLLNST